MKPDPQRSLTPAVTSAADFLGNGVDWPEAATQHLIFMAELRILHLEDNGIDAELIRAVLEAAGIPCAIDRVETRTDFEARLAPGRFDLIISDFTLPSFDGMTALKISREKCPLTPFIFVSGTIGEEVAVDSLKQGATDYVLKDRLSRLVASVPRAMRDAQVRAERQRIGEELHHRNELFRQITENVDDLIVVLDADGKRVYSSRSYLRLLGEPDSALLTDFFSEIHPEDRERVRRLFGRAIAAGSGHRAEYRILAKDGSVRDIEAQASVVRDAGGGVKNVVVVSRDVTDRKAAEQALVAAETKFRTLVEQSIVGIYIVQEGRLLYVNPKMAELFGSTPAEMVMHSWLDFVVEEDRALAEENLRLRLEGAGPSAPFLLRMRRKDGTAIQAEMHGGRTEYNGRAAIIGTLLDVTERKQAETKVREQAALLDKATDAIYVRDLEQRITYWNKGAERIYGWRESEALGTLAADLLYRGNQPQRADIWQAVLQKGEWVGELRQVTRTGREIVVESRRTLLRDADGQPAAVLNINTDVTDKRQIEAQLLRAQRLENIGVLAGGIAHDLNNVLGPILVVGYLLRDKLPNEESRRMLDTATTSARRGAEMVKQILSFARGVAGEPVMLQVKHLVDEIVKLAKETFPRSINIATKIGDDLRPIMGDATQLHQVLLNLCVNARDAMPEGGTISIEAENIILEGVKTPMQEQPLSGPHLQLRVSDTGCGIDPAVLDKIFEPFFTTKEDGKGTGLGLSTVLSIVKSHGGMLEVLSQVGRGTTFKICLPVAAATETERARRKPRPPPLGRGELVLLVEDEMAILEITKELLESFNYRVLTATDGVEAVTLYRQRKGEIQLVVTDLMMPIMDGPALIRALRQLDPKAKVIVVSGLGSTAQLADVNDLNVQAYLTKPYSTELLMTTLRNALNGQ